MMAKLVIITRLEACWWSSRWRHVGGVHGGAMAMETTMIPKAILLTI
jgi:hypothetical protein